jgi:hypothetical protein
VAVSHHRALSCPDFPLHSFPYSGRPTRRTKKLLNFELLESILQRILYQK